MAPRRNFPSIGTSAPLAKIGMQVPLPVSPNSYRELFRSDTSLTREYSSKAPWREEMKHNFAIQALKKPSFFARRPYIYLCVRCRQIFLVNEHRGSIVAIDCDRNPIPEPENSRRVETFAEGPCLAFKSASKKFPRQRHPAAALNSSMMKRA
jgi:hypothetical protein